MSEDEQQEVRAALRQRFGDNEKEIKRMLGFYEGYHLTVRGFFRRWFERRLGEHASWMLDFVSIRLIAGVAVARGLVVTIPAPRRDTSRRGVYVCIRPNDCVVNRSSRAATRLARRIDVEKAC